MDNKDINQPVNINLDPETMRNMDTKINEGTDINLDPQTLNEMDMHQREKEMAQMAADAEAKRMLEEAIESKSEISNETEYSHITK